MAQQSRADLNALFLAGAEPTAANFEDVFTSNLNLEDDSVITGAITTASVTKGLVTLVATGAITAAAHAGRTLLMGEVGGNAIATFTLPAATGTGNVYKFVVSVVNTSNYVIQVVGDDTIDGKVFVANDVANHASNNSVIVWKTVAASDTITLDGTTTGGVSIGDYVELIDIAADQWSVSGMLEQSGTEATPFSAAVS